MKKRNIKPQYLIGLVLTILTWVVYGQAINNAKPVKAANFDRAVNASSIELPDDGANLVVFSPDANTLASKGSDGQVILWDVASGQVRATLASQFVSPVNEIVFSSDGNTLASVSENSIQLWDSVSGDVRLTLSESAAATKLVFSSDGKTLAAVDKNADIIIWDSQSGAATQVLDGHQSGFTALAFSPDSKLLATVDKGAQIKLWDWVTGLERAGLAGLGEESGNAAVTDLLFSPEGKTLAVVSQDASIRLWDLQSGVITQVMTGHHDGINALAFSSDSKTLASGGQDALIKLWDKVTGLELARLVGEDGVAITDLAFSPDGKYLASVSESDSILLWDLSNKKSKQLTGHNDWVTKIAFSPNLKTLVSVSKTGQVVVWDLKTGGRGSSFQAPLLSTAVKSAQIVSPQQELASANTNTSRTAEVSQVLGLPNGQSSNGVAVSQGVKNGGNKKRSHHDWKGLTALAISPNGAFYGGATKDGSVRLWASSGKERFAISEHHGSAVTGVVFSADGKQLISVGRDTEVQMMDVGSGKKGQTLLAHEHPIRAVAASPDGKFLASAGEETRVMLWDARTGKLVKILTGHSDFVNAVSFSADGAHLASAGADGRILVWDVNTGQLVQTLEGHSDEVNALAFSRDGAFLASGGADSLAILWDAASGQKIQSLAGHQSPIRAVAFSPNGQKLVSAGEDTKVLIWDTATRKLDKQMVGSTNVMSALVFGPGGNLIAGGEDGEIKEWDVEKDQIRQVIKLPVPPQSNNSEEILKLPFGDVNQTASNSIGHDAYSVSKQSPKLELSQVLDRLINWLIPAAGAAIPNPPGGPILIVTSTCPTCGVFNQFYAEILRAEGLNEFATADISTVTAASLASYDVVILASTPLTSTQVNDFTTWVNNGGNLIAIKPDPKLASLLGLTAAGTTLSNAYLLVDTLQAPGKGIVNQPIQFHGAADRYTISGATNLATLYSNVSTATTNPALTLRNVGVNGGQASAFTYDLATSIVYTRQGNPAWQAQERDGFSPIRSDDKYYGNATGDSQPDWVDLLTAVAVPQADEQQRLLANLITQMNLAKKPLPRFWYFPRGEKAVVIMTGDDHGNGGTGPRFDQFNSLSPAGCNVANWECIRGTSYIYVEPALLSDAKAAAYTAAGFEVGLHINTNCADYTPASLDSFYFQQLANFHSNYPSIPAPITERHHCIAWSDWTTGALTEFKYGMRLDTSYYFWPPSWVNNRPGNFTGSAMPMRFADLSGNLIDVYQAVSHMTDESGQTYPFTINTLLDRAVGATGYYGAYTINAHTDLPTELPATETVNSAIAHGVPVVSSAQMLTWLDGRNGSSFSTLAWNGSNLTFSVATAPGANGLQAMLPVNSATGVLLALSGPNGAVGFSIDTIKGVQYAFFDITAGAYSATYGADTTPPAVTVTSPANNAIGVTQQPTVTATFNEPLDSATITAANFQLQAGNNPPVSATVSYDASTRTAKLTPNTLLGVSTTYTAKLSTGIKDVAGNALVTPYNWSFTTQTQQLCSSAPCSAWNSSTTPGNPSANDSGSVELGVKFNSDLAGVITGIRFYNVNPGSYVVNLWSGAGANLGQKLATTTITDSVSGWHQANFLTPVAITANTVYVASYHAPSGHYAGDNLFFANAGVDTLPIHLLKDGLSGGNGVYAYSTTSIFPANTYQSTNYWVDVVFSSNTGPDTIAPTVITTLPVAAALGVNPVNPVKATFSESVNVTTVNSSTFELRDPTNVLITSTITYDAGTNTAILTPTATLAANTSYTAKLVSGPSGVKDLVGNALAANYIWSFTTGIDPCAAGGNPIVCENSKLGNAASEWDIIGAGDTSIQGFATDISVNHGSSVAFKVSSAAAYQIDIYRMGYYGGLGARKIDTIPSTATISKLQPNCLTDATGLIDCGNWTVSASWNVPATAASGIYFAKLKRIDTGGASHIVFVVRDDASTANMVFQTSDTTWQAYNNYGGNSLYSGTGPGTGGSSDGRAYKVSYNRPFNTRAVANGQDWVFNAEYPMVRWLEANGYDVSYLAGLDTDRFGSLIRNHKVFISVGHDEYWSGAQRANIETARDVGGVHLAFFSGNEVYWKMRWETSIDGTNTANRTLVCYKETHNFPNNRDPADVSPTWTWTGTWRDPRNTPPADGGRPENALLGPIFMVNDGATTSITVPQADGKMRFWRNTSIANLASGATATLPFGTLGYEWDVDLDNGFRPAGLVRNSTTIVNNAPVLTDFGSTFGSGTANHALTLYRSASGAIVFGAGTVQWSWGLDGNHDRGNTLPDLNMQQATVNLFADMGSQPATIQSGLQLATASGDNTPPTSTILSPTTGSTLPTGSLVTITGTAIDTGGGQVGGIEISVDGGLTWHAATGRGNWSYAWTTPSTSGQFNIKTRSVDDSLNLEVPGAGVTLNVGLDTTPPTAPSGLIATVNGTQISLSWTASSDAVGVTGYLLERCQNVACSNFSQIAAPTATSFLDSGLISLTTYQYRLRATDAAGNLSTYSGVATQTTQSVPIAVADRFLFLANNSRTVNYAGVLGLGVLANDTDPTNLRLTAAAVGTLPTGVALASNGVVTVNLSRATTFRYRASNGTFLSQPTTGAVVTLNLDSVPTAAVDNCTYVRAGSGSIRSGAACVMTGPQAFTMNLKANDSDPNTTTNVPSDGIGKTVTGAVINSTGIGVSVSANVACGQAAIANGSSLATITNNCDGSLAVNVNTAAAASPITFAYRAIDDLGAQSNSRTNTVTLQ